jgi:hypothetical protein
VVGGSQISRQSAHEGGKGVPILRTFNPQKIFLVLLSVGGPGSVVGIATGYGLDGPGIESRWRRGFPHLSRPALGSTQTPVQLVPGLSRG